MGDSTDHDCAGEDSARVSTPEFSNRQIPKAAIADYREIDFARMAAGFRRYTLVSTLVWGVPAVLAAVLATWLGKLPAQLSLLAPAGMALTVMAAAGYRWIEAGYRGWALREHDLAACSGVLWRSFTALPIARIQHLETSHGPLERAFGLARLQLFTAGGMTADLVVIGMRRDNADRLREYLVEQIRLPDAPASKQGLPGPESGSGPSEND